MGNSGEGVLGSYGLRASLRSIKDKPRVSKALLGFCKWHVGSICC